MTVKEAKQIPLSSPSAALDLSCFLQEITGLTKTGLLLNQNMELTKAQEEKLAKWCKLRETGLPVAYILNKKDFYGRTFYVDQNVLIPKPDTEILVERAVSLLSGKNGLLAGYDSSFSVADICTGSGCIGLSVLLECQDSVSSMTMTDISPQALEVAQKNACALASDTLRKKIVFSQGDLMDGLTDFDVILSNPPYVPHTLAQELLKDGRSEPMLALDGDAGPQDSCQTEPGLSLPVRLLSQIYVHLKKGGVFLMELGEYNIEKACQIASSMGFANLTIHPDLEGQLRVLEGRKC